MVTFSLKKWIEYAFKWQLFRIGIEVLILDPWWNSHTPEGKLAIWLKEH